MVTVVAVMGKVAKRVRGKFFLFAAEGVDFESVAGADQGRGWGFREGRRGKKEKFFFGGLRRIDLQGDDDERRAEMCRQQQAGIVCNLNGGGSVGPVGKRKKKEYDTGIAKKVLKSVGTQEHGAVIPFISFPPLSSLSSLSFLWQRKKKNPNSRKI